MSYHAQNSLGFYNPWAIPGTPDSGTDVGTPVCLAEKAIASALGPFGLWDVHDLCTQATLADCIQKGTCGTQECIDETNANCKAWAPCGTTCMQAALLYATVKDTTLITDCLECLQIEYDKCNEEFYVSNALDKVALSTCNQVGGLYDSRKNQCISLTDSIDAIPGGIATIENIDKTHKMASGQIPIDSNTTNQIYEKVQNPPAYLTNKVQQATKSSDDTANRLSVPIALAIGIAAVGLAYYYSKK